MDIGFIGLGNMGGPMARRLIEAGHKLVVYDTRNDAVAPLVALGAQLASSPQDVADRVETVMASLPSLQISEKVATGEGGVIHGKRVKRFIDLSTTGSRVAAEIAAALAKKNIVQIDCPVSGGVGGASKGTLAVMVSGPQADIDAVKDALAVFGKVFIIGDKPGMAQTMKLANNFLSAAAMAATAEAVAMGVKAGLDADGDDRRHQCRLRPQHGVRPEVPASHPAAHVQLRLRHRADAQGRAALLRGSRKSSARRMTIMRTVLDQWETTNTEYGGDSDFTHIVQMIEKRAGVIVGGNKK